MLKPGLYENLINKKIAAYLEKIEANDKDIKPIEPTEAPSILAKYLSSVLEKALQQINSDNALNKQIDLTNRLISIVEETLSHSENDANIDDDLENNTLTTPEQLLGIADSTKPINFLTKNRACFIRPQTSMTQTSLFTGSMHEPQLYTELKKEISSANEIYMLVSFIRWSGLIAILNDLRKFTENDNHKLRIITTSYMGATELKAIEELSKLPNTEIKISYDVDRTRLHAKAYVFVRDTGLTTAYVGSSNMSRVALSSGLEWNLKITASDLPQMLKKILATFDNYWHATEFETYDQTQYEKLASALKSTKAKETGNSNIFFDIRPYAYQQDILDKLAAERLIHQHYKNLVVAATGCGKTVIAAFDFKRFSEEYTSKHKKSPKLLFIAHRSEILHQGMATFRAILRDQNFGEMWDSNNQPTSFTNLFVTIQTLNSKNTFDKIQADYFEFIVIDEFHHAAAKTYQSILNKFTPKILLGLTATPERADGADILRYFDNEIAAEIRLPEAIDRKLLCPFQYFGVTDTIDLKDLKWSKGGYLQTDLEQLYVIETEKAIKRANMIFLSLKTYVSDIENIKALGFCVSVKHAEFMSQQFNEFAINNNINARSTFLSGNSTLEDRENAPKLLKSQQLQIIFVVDLYNEGIDIPEINTVLFLRPTESLTVFLQQLGRGLRLAPNKECLTVLDFIGNANYKYSFAEKFKALLAHSHKSLPDEILDGFTSVPKGCYISLEETAQKFILDNIRGLWTNSNKIIAAIKSFGHDYGLEPTLTNFIRCTNIEITRLFNTKVSFSRLCVKAGVREEFNDPDEELISKNLKRLCYINSRRFIEYILNLLKNSTALDILNNPKLDTTAPTNELRIANMLLITIWPSANLVRDTLGNIDTKIMLNKLFQNRTILAEIIEILQINLHKIDFVDSEVLLDYPCPLDGYCNYSRDQIFIALDYMKPQDIREGVKYLPNKKTDVLLVTINKSSKDFTPNTMYEDYSIDETHFHWQSQNQTSEASATGKRYVNHEKLNSTVLLFVREYKELSNKDSSPYTYLGKAFYKKHQGSKPMSIEWRLEKPIPAKFINQTSQLLAS
jgi:superfamily II DNA or RNA helicase